MNFLRFGNICQIEEQLKNLLPIFKAQQNEVNKALKKKNDAVMFIGHTGSGKSTLVNWLNKGEFEDRFPLTLKKYEEQMYSKTETRDGWKYVQIHPSYFHNEEQNILTIILPGFKDKRGNVVELIQKMMYMEIVHQFNTKVVVVAESKKSQLDYSSSTLMKLVQTTFQPNDAAQFDSISLILNKFGKYFFRQKKIRQLKQYVVKDLAFLGVHCNQNYQKIYQALKTNIQVVEEIRNKKNQNKIFSDENRIALWQSIKATKPIKIEIDKIEIDKIEIDKIENSEELGQYLQIQSYNFLQSIQSELEETFKLDKLENFPQKKLESINNILKEWIDNLKKENDFNQFAEAINFLNKLSEIDGMKIESFEELKNSTEPLFWILNFFKQYQQQIKFYQDFQQIAQRQMNYLSLYQKIVEQILQKETLKMDIEKLKKDHKAEIDEMRDYNKQIENPQFRIFMG